MTEKVGSEIHVHQFPSVLSKARQYQNTEVDGDNFNMQSLFPTHRLWLDWQKRSYLIALMDNIWFNGQVLRSYNASPNTIRTVQGVRAIIAVQIPDSLTLASYTCMVYDGHRYW